MTRAPRLIWIVNHRTLLPAEVPIFRDLGFEVLIPKIIPEHDPGYRSGVVTHGFDSSLTIPAAALKVLNSHDFYQRAWGPTVTGIINEHFDVIVTSISAYLTPLAQAASRFEGHVIARVFGREQPRRYAEFFSAPGAAPILKAVEAMGDRFVFGQGFSNLAEVEDDVFRMRAHTMTVPLPMTAYESSGTWRGGGERALFLCPGILEYGYYRDIYQGIKRDFGNLPHAIFGRQTLVIDDAALLPYLSDGELTETYATTPVFVYPSTEPRHVHYSPIEAMVVGAPVLYRRGALIDILAGETLPGACADTDEMRDKATRLIHGDDLLAQEIRDSQAVVVQEFALETAARQWAEILVPMRELRR